MNWMTDFQGFQLIQSIVESLKLFSKKTMILRYMKF